MKKEPRIIISGGGTGGHIFPALSIANALKKLNSKSEILFVGALGRMEMERIPAAGYKIIGLPVAGLQRSLSLSNLKLPILLVRSLIKARRVIKEFNPDVAVGVGGYASAPLLRMAGKMGIPYIIQEQNSYAGITNRMLAKKASLICVAYPGMERFFPQEKIVLTGNPVRENILPVTAQMKESAKEYFEIGKKDKTILIIGGSLGSGTLNESAKKWIKQTPESDIALIWQCGKYYYNDVTEFNRENPRNFVRSYEFIKEMDKALAAADVVISRAGAGTISELCIAGKAVIFVPSPNVAEDHQRYNALSLVKRDAALMINDSDAIEQVMESAVNLANNPTEIERLEKEIQKAAIFESDTLIAQKTTEIINGL